MSKRFKSVNFYETQSKSVAVINGATVIKDVVIVQSGVDKVGDLMDDDFIKSIAAQGNMANTGIKCRGGHPNMCKDSLGTYIGDYHNFRAVEQDGKFKAIADLYISDLAKKTQIDGKGISYHDYVVEMAKNHPDKFGNSIVFMADAEETDHEGKSVYKLSLKEGGFIASDIVDSPAATDGLFKNDDDLGVKLSDFLDDNPEILKSLDKNPEAIQIFFKKYINNSKNKGMSILKSLQILLGAKQKSLELTDASGAVLTIETDNETPAVGDAVTIGGSPAADGEYIMPDTSKLMVMDGKVSEIIPAEEKPVEDTPAEPQMSDVQKSIDTLKKSFDEKLKAVEEKHKSEIEDLQASVKFLGEQIKSGYVPDEAEAIGAGKSKAKKEGESRFTIDKQKLQEKVNKN